MQSNVIKKDGISTDGIIVLFSGYILQSYGSIIAFTGNMQIHLLLCYTTSRYIDSTISSAYTLGEILTFRMQLKSRHRFQGLVWCKGVWHIPVAQSTHYYKLKANDVVARHSVFSIVGSQPCPGWYKITLFCKDYLDWLIQLRNTFSRETIHPFQQV